MVQKQHKLNFLYISGVMSFTGLSKILSCVLIVCFFTLVFKKTFIFFYFLHQYRDQQTQSTSDTINSMFLFFFIFIL